MNEQNAPATKADIAALDQKITVLDQKITEALDENIAMVRAEIHHISDDLKEQMRDNQTELLRAFYGHMQTQDTRLNSSEEELAALKKRLGILESRMKDVEFRLNMPPAA